MAPLSERVNRTYLESRHLGRSFLRLRWFLRWACRYGERCPMNLSQKLQFIAIVIIMTAIYLFSH
jgi:hypothetical protein